MREKLFIVLFFPIAIFSKAQVCDANQIFLQSYYDATLVNYEKDTTNLWQVGNSDKTILNFWNVAIMTDTLNYYPPNSNSSFQLKIPAGFMGVNYLHFEYKTNTDTLTDYGLIELSIDNGNTWLDIDSLLGVINPPVLTGTVTSNFEYNFNYSIIPGFVPADCDTIRYKFSFISDSINTNKEGILYYIDLYNWRESIEEANINSNILIYPNPSRDITIIEDLNGKAGIIKINITDVLGRKINQINPSTNKTKIDVSQLPSGIYFLQMQSKNGVVSKKFVKQ